MDLTMQWVWKGILSLCITSAVAAARYDAVISTGWQYEPSFPVHCYGI